MDACGVVLATLTQLLLLYGNFAGNYLFIYYWHYQYDYQEQLIPGIPLDGIGLLFALVFNFFCICSVVAHIRAAFSDPGHIPHGFKQPEWLQEGTYKYCKKCPNETWKPERAHHCSECGSCVFKMDHHCPWINNCVGLKNFKFFILFVLYTGLAAALLTIMMVISFYYLMTDSSKMHMQKRYYSHAFIAAVFAFIEGILFTFFCFELIQEQAESIEDNQSYVDDMKELAGRPQTFFKNMQDNFGHDWPFWPLPTYPLLKVNYFEKLYTVKQIERLPAFEEEEYDADKKIFGKLRNYVFLERKMFGALWFATVIGYIFLCKYYLFDTWEEMLKAQIEAASNTRSSSSNSAFRQKWGGRK